jgi:hypothetical protein
MNYISNINPCFYPAAAAAIAFVTERTAVGTVGLTVKGASKVAEYFGQNQISQNLKQTGDNLIAHATRNAETELKIASTLLNIGGVVYMATNTLSGEINAIAPTPEMTRFQKITEFVGLTSPATFSEGLINTAERIVTNVGESPTLAISAPFSITVAGSVILRTSAGLTGATAKVAGLTMNLVGLNSIGQPVNDKADNLIAFATKNINTEMSILNIIQFSKCMYQIGTGIKNGAYSVGNGIYSLGQRAISPLTGN